MYRLFIVLAAAGLMATGCAQNKLALHKKAGAADQVQLCSGECDYGCDACCDGDPSCGPGCSSGDGSGLFGKGDGSGLLGSCGGRGCGHCKDCLARLRARLAGNCYYNPGPPSASTAYPYYTVRGPRDFLMCNPPSLGPQ